MSNFKGFSAKAKTNRTNKKIRLSDPKLTFKFEKYVASELGRSWNSDCLLMAVEGLHGIVKLVVPTERKDFFTDEVIQKLQTMAISFGLKRLNVEKSNLTKASLVRLYSSRRPTTIQ